MNRGEHTTKELILQAGKKEFLNKGFHKASLREIAHIAGVTTGAIYGCYEDKEALFNALVEEPAAYLLEQFLLSQRGFDALPPEEKGGRMNTYTMDAQNKMLDYIYDHIDAFRLIVNASHGTRYAGYIDKLVEIEEEYLHRFHHDLRVQGHEMEDITPDIVHILCSSCFHGIFEIVAHDIPKEEAVANLRLLAQFYRMGWNHLLKLYSNGK